MEKTKNSWYKAVSIMQYIVASLFTVGTVCMIIVGLTQGEKVAEVLNEAKLLDENGNIMVFNAESVKTLVFGMTILMAPLIVVMYIEAVIFGKHIYMTDAEAAASYKTCLVWTIIMFFVGGNLPGILALVGLLKIHARQKESFMLSASSEKIIETNADVEQNEINNKTEIIEAQEENKVQNSTEKQAERLAKLEKLNAEGALTEEEYKHLKDTIMKK